MANTKETLVDWLRDAHAMESSIVTMLEKQSGKLDGYPTMKAKIDEHLDVTRDQMDRVKGLLERLGGDTSTVKEAAGKFFTNIQGMMAGVPKDAVVKNALGNFSVEHFEIASYRSLIAAADALGETEVKRVCQQILEEELEMAEWLERQIPVVTQDFLRKEASPRT